MYQKFEKCNGGFEIFIIKTEKGIFFRRSESVQIYPFIFMCSNLSMQDKGSSTLLCSFHFKTKHPYNGHIFRMPLQYHYILVVSQQMFNYTNHSDQKEKKNYSNHCTEFSCRILVQIVNCTFMQSFYFELKPLRDNSDNVNSVSFCMSMLYENSIYVSSPLLFPSNC